MLDFRLDDEQKMLVAAIERYSKEQVRKVFREAEEQGEIPMGVVQAGWEIGVLPTAIPEEFGGFGEHSAVSGSIATEHFAWGDLAITLKLMSPNLVAVPLMLSGTDQQKADYLPHFCGETMPLVTAALTEPTVQFNPHKLKTRAVREGDEYVISGRKVFVIGAISAETHLIYASENDQTQAFLVPTNSGGLTIDNRDKLMGINALDTYKITLNNVRVPASAKLGGEAGCNFQLILNHSRVAVAAAAVGVANAGFMYARDYAKQRRQFGRFIAQNQSIAFMLATMATDIDAARLMVWETAWQLDQGNDATRAATLMKQYVNQVVLDVADRAVQTLGGYGYIREYPVELWLRNARGFVTFDGIAII